MEKFDECFKNVIGYEEIKSELKRIVDIMVNPEKYKKLGVKTPKNILLEGEPGMGKTLIADCFIKASGRKAFVCRKNKPNGDFVNEIKMIYEKAKENAPSIILLDDMDKFANEDDMHKNAEEYVAIQTCIDETRNVEVFTVATINETDLFPDSLLRVGRFDKHLKLQNPSEDDAKKIIEYFLSQKKYVGNLNIDEIARILAGHSCATLETIINEAGIYAGFNDKNQIETSDIIRASMRLLFNAPETLSKDDQSRINEIAYHEAGHAVVAEILEPESVNIVSVKKYSGDIGGITSHKQSNNYFNSMKCMENRVVLLLAGKASTEMVFGVTDVGSNSDIHRARDIVERFVDDYCAYGFDRFEYARCHSNELLSRKENLIYSEMERYYQFAKRILAKNRELLDKLANALVEKDTLLSCDVQLIKSTCKIVEFGPDW